MNQAKGHSPSAGDRLVATVEPDGEGLLVLLPDGDVRSAKDSITALKLVNKWSERHTRATGKTTVTQLDWRRGAVPPGIAPGSVEVLSKQLCPCCRRLIAVNAAGTFVPHTNGLRRNHGRRPCNGTPPSSVRSE